MIYSMVKFKIIEHKKEKEWKAVFYDIEGDREDFAHHPNSAGFYYYPRELGKEYAFEALRTHLIKKHKEEIELLEKSLKKLIGMKFEGK